MLYVLLHSVRFLSVIKVFYISGFTQPSCRGNTELLDGGLVWMTETTQLKQVKGSDFGLIGASLITTSCVNLNLRVLQLSSLRCSGATEPPAASVTEAECEQCGHQDDSRFRY